MNDLDQFEHEGGLKLAETAPLAKKPRMYKVIILNDDFTPMDFVVELLISFFGMNQARAIETMLQVHKSGKGICGTYTKDIAETKVAQVNTHARHHHYPLLCIMEVE